MANHLRKKIAELEKALKVAELNIANLRLKVHRMQVGEESPRPNSKTFGEWKLTSAPPDQWDAILGGGGAC